MVTASMLGLPAAVLLLISMPCVNLGDEGQSAKNKQALLGGTLTLLVGKSDYFWL